MTGLEFNELVHNSNINFYKFTSSWENSFGYQFESGLNIDSEDFDPFCVCCAGGIYFADSANMRYNYSDYYKFIRRVTVPNITEAWIKIEFKKIKATHLILDNERIAISIEYWIATETGSPQSIVQPKFMGALDNDNLSGWISQNRASQ